MARAGSRRLMIDPQTALDRCDAGTALDAVGALVITGPTGVNHADLVVIG
jgi:glycerate-2-kinase